MSLIYYIHLYIIKAIPLDKAIYLAFSDALNNLKKYCFTIYSYNGNILFLKQKHFVFILETICFYYLNYFGTY